MDFRDSALSRQRHDKSRRLLAFPLTAALVATAAIAGACGLSGGSGDNAKGEVVTIRTVTVGDPGNPSIGVVSAFGTQGEFVDPPANGGIYANCDEAPPGPPNCVPINSLDYAYQIGETEITVAQYVAFLNTVDPEGRNANNLLLDSASPTVWPKYGSVSLSTAEGVAPGEHYSVAYPEWANKPFGFTDFRRAARFVNSLVNGDVLSREESSADGVDYVTYEVRLSPKSEEGMYDLEDPATTREISTGFVIPSNDEWVKAAYYDPQGGGILSYWQYPTGPSDPPNVSRLDPATGDVINADEQPLSTYSPNAPNAPVGTYPTWCPPQAGEEACASTNANNLSAGLDTQIYQANLSTVGQTKTPSPWGALDMGGNVVEWQDTIVDAPPGYSTPRVWRRLHGGVANAPGYQLLISAFGVQPDDNAFTASLNPWVGFRVGIIGDLR